MTRRSVRGLAHQAIDRVANRSSTNAESLLPAMPTRPSLKPVLPVHDMDVAIAFYRSLGFVVDSYDGGYAWVKNCGWEVLHLAAAPHLQPGSAVGGAYVHVGDTRAWHSAIVGAAPDADVGEVADQPWGMREFAVTDPSGNTVRFGQNL